jgi:asparagine synthetase B (glutamine-hydrolysing)
MWIISNRSIAEPPAKGSIKYDRYCFFSTDNSVKITSSDQWLHEGHLFPRQSESVAVQKAHGNELPAALFKKYGDQFIRHLKGNFILIHLKEDGFQIYCDRFGIKKYFYWTNGDEFIISNDLKSITDHIQTKPSPESMIIYALTFHFIDGITLFENVHYNRPAEVLEYKNGKLSFSKYWDASELLRINKCEVEIGEISDALDQCVQQSLNLISTDAVSLSLTGGADTRNLLAIFLRLGAKPHLYTYGDPASSDCVRAKTIAEGLNLRHIIYDFKMTTGLYTEYAKKVIKSGSSLASIHRAHRLMAIEHEKNHASYMFLGTLGGEFIKGVSEDDYIVPALLYENWNRPSLKSDLISEHFQRKALRDNAIDMEHLAAFLNSQPLFSGEVLRRKLFALSDLTASLHDAQDINIYATIMAEVFTPFLDIDYLEMVFSSRYSFDNKERRRNPFSKRIDNPVYSSRFLRHVYPALLKFEYSGNHKPKEVLFSKYYAASTRYIRTRLRAKYPPNFPLSDWMEEFVAVNLPLCFDNDALRKTFDLDSLLSAFKRGNHQTKEPYWLKYTNPIMIKFIIEEYAH